MIKKFSDLRSRIPSVLLDLVILAVLFWVVRYWHSAHFGLYEDDLTFIPGAVAQHPGDLLKSIWESTISFEDQGRPLHHDFILLFSKVGWSINHLLGLYWIGYAITLVNICLFYWLIFRVTNRTFALIAGLIYVLYSADTTQAYLTLSLGVQPSLTFLFLAFHSYLSGRYTLTYLLSALILFGYETPFPIFLAAPLLIRNWNIKTIKKLVLHGMIVGLILLAVYFFRVFIGSGLRDEFNFRDLLFTSIKHMLKGPIVSLGSFFYRPLELIKLLNPEIGIALLLSFFFFLWIFSRLPDNLQLNSNKIRYIFRQKCDQQNSADGIMFLVQMVSAGIVMLVGSYTLSFTVSTGYIAGRATRVHMPGVVGVSVLLACVIYFLIYLSNSVKWRKGVYAFIALELALMTAYGFTIQHDYVQAWQYQQKFWTELLPLISDANPSTVVLVDPAVFTDVSQIGANTWNLPRILNQLFIYPSNVVNNPDLEAVPRVYRLAPLWDQSIISQDKKIQLNGLTTIAPPSCYTEVESQQVIFIESTDGHLIRRNNPLVLEGVLYSLKPLSESVMSGLPHGILYELLIVSP